MLSPETGIGAISSTMESTMTVPPPVKATLTAPVTTANTAAQNWPVPVLVFASACITVGILWDISWHTTIGRDTFWTPAHLMIYLGGTLGGCAAGWLALVATLLEREKSAGTTISILGARAPLGAWVALWGAAAMLTSAPLDDWWHNAYGLDVKILYPPHALLAAGMYGVVTGAVLLAAAARNRVIRDPLPAPGLVIVALGIQLTLASILLTEFSFPNLQHTSTFYLVSAAMYPTFLIAAAQFSPTRWAATKVALVYLTVGATMVWVLPWFPAEPQLAPIFNRVTHMTPPSFPLLLVVPAVALDLLFQGSRAWNWKGISLLRTLAAATLFVGLFLPVQWYFSRFLISPAADHQLLAGHGRFLGYMAQRDEWQAVFWRLDRDPLTLLAVGKMWLLALLAVGLGQAAGVFLCRVRR